nr:hypothetical protein [Streptomyces sp. TLI_55]
MATSSAAATVSSAAGSISARTGPSLRSPCAGGGEAIGVGSGLDDVAAGGIRVLVRQL